MTDFYELLQTPEAMKVLRALATSPSQARRLLREVGITDKNGELKPPYRTQREIRDESRILPAETP